MKTALLTSMALAVLVSTAAMANPRGLLLPPAAHPPHAINYTAKPPADAGTLNRNCTTTCRPTYGGGQTCDTYCY
jgi:hypothetical protein